MGVPKFYRWISERYPTLSEVINDSQIPEFDNLYLDMNGIIHNCSHPNDDDVMFRISEEQVNHDIFAYIEKLFLIIRPQKVFLMAVDGVAPRAKMNQQRARRFMSARTAQEQLEKAIKKGEQIPDQARFDSNCITPGTPFMTRLHSALREWIAEKISYDPKWQNIRIILSGHDVPGEGEHKIMDFIRYERAQDGYDPNTRHCMYGLDADLMMLGICSHEPHFSLLREEVKYSTQTNRRKLKKGEKVETKKSLISSEITFHLLHLSLMREYLYWEFASIKDQLSFPYDMERIADDWILMCFLIGNDFIPHLPHVHIHDDGLPFLYDAYRKVLPTLEGYINEAGHLNLKRFEKFLKFVADNDKEHFLKQMDDDNFYFGKREQPVAGPSKGKQGKFDALLELEEKEEKLVEFEDSDMESSDGDDLELEIQTQEAEAHDPAFISSDEEEEEESPKSSSSSGEGENGPIESASQALARLDIDDPAMSEFEQQLGMAALAPLDEKEFESNVAACWSRTIGNSFKRHKRDYYREKLRFGNISKTQLKEQSEGYVRAIQWVLHYYYHGCASWSWYFPHHYAPYISDVTDFGEMEMNFELSAPFRPFEQLLAVLPAASSECLPPSLRELMCSSESPISDFYPTNFKTDLNGKRNDWEAVVLIPFIDEKRLLEAIQSKEKLLTAEERARNSYGPHFAYTTEKTSQGVKSQVAAIEMNTYRIPREKVIWGLLPNVKLDVYFPGFPTMKHLSHTGTLKKIGVQVFNFASRCPSMMLTIGAREDQERGDLSTLAADLIGKEVCVEWPVLKMGIVDHVMSLTHSYTKTGAAGDELTVEELSSAERDGVGKKLREMKDRLLIRYAVDCGDPKAVVYVRRFMGVIYKPEDGQLRPVKQFGPLETAIAVPINLVVTNVSVDQGRRLKEIPIEEAFYRMAKVFLMLHNSPCYGKPSLIDAIENPGPNCRIRVITALLPEPNLSALRADPEKYGLPWYDQFTAAKYARVNRHLYSRITGTILLVDGARNPDAGPTQRINIGLNLKLTKRNLEMPDYTRRTGNIWTYSSQTNQLIEDYRRKFPEIFKLLDRSISNTDEYYSHEIWPVETQREVRLAELKAYLDGLPTFGVEMQEAGSVCVDSLLFSCIEEEHEKVAAEMTNNPKSVESKKTSVSPNVIYMPEIHDGKVCADPEADYMLLDRVSNTSTTGNIPVAYAGTVIGIYGDKVEVLFDKPFKGGFKRGIREAVARVPITSLINMTYAWERKTRKEAFANRMAATASKKEKIEPQSQQVLKMLNAKKAGVKASSSSSATISSESQKAISTLTKILTDVDAKKKKEIENGLASLLGINGKKSSAESTQSAAASIAAKEEPVIPMVMKILQREDETSLVESPKHQSSSPLEATSSSSQSDMTSNKEKISIVNSAYNHQGAKPPLLPTPPQPPAGSMAVVPPPLMNIPPPPLPAVQPILPAQAHMQQPASPKPLMAKPIGQKKQMIPTSNVDPMKLTDLKPSTVSIKRGTGRGGARGGRGRGAQRGGQQQTQNRAEQSENRQIEEPKQLAEIRDQEKVGKKQRRSRLAATFATVVQK